jgi:hypothetical protein
VQEQAAQWARYEGAVRALAVLGETVTALEDPGVTLSRSGIAAGLSEAYDELATLLAVEEPPAPVVEAPPGLDLRVHSRACGIVPHGHGSACHKNCPTCGGRADFEHVGMQGSTERPGL